MSKKEKQYIAKFIEAQNNQFNPGHYIGGKLPLDITENKDFIGIQVVEVRE